MGEREGERERGRAGFTSPQAANTVVQFIPAPASDVMCFEMYRVSNFQYLVDVIEISEAAILVTRNHHIDFGICIASFRRVFRILVSGSALAFLGLKGLPGD